MSDPRGFLEHRREEEDERPIEERVHDYREFIEPFPPGKVAVQASRCMGCGIPFCHEACPLGNLIPEWNDLVREGRLAEAAERLLATNNFPEVTGRVCPAPCEASCVLNLDGEPVTIKAIERSISESVTLAPRRAPKLNGKSVAVVGSGPAGLACAQELARMGHEVVVYERDDAIGGLLRYGIPDFKMEKVLVDRRVLQMEQEGVVFRTGIAIGTTTTSAELLGRHDALVLAIGARVPRDLDVPGRSLEGVHYAMEFLEAQNRRVAAGIDGTPTGISAKGKRVLVLGGGDTGSDCIGTSVRQGAKEITNVELMPRPPLVRFPTNPWPEWPLVLRTSSSHEEGAMREFAVRTKALRGEAGHVVAAEMVRVEIANRRAQEVPGSEFLLPCDLVLLAMGFTGPEKTPFDELGLARDPRGNVLTNTDGRTNVARVFAAGDAVRGQSLVVHAIADGRRVARGVARALLETPSSTATL